MNLRAVNSVLQHADGVKAEIVETVPVWLPLLAHC